MKDYGSHWETVKVISNGKSLPVPGFYTSFLRLPQIPFSFIMNTSHKKSEEHTNAPVLLTLAVWRVVLFFLGSPVCSAVLSLPEAQADPGVGRPEDSFSGARRPGLPAAGESLRRSLDLFQTQSSFLLSAPDTGGPKRSHGYTAALGPCGGQQCDRCVVVCSPSGSPATRAWWCGGPAPCPQSSTVGSRAPSSP